jgi:adenine-specific DNA-methyltransferase
MPTLNWIGKNKIINHHQEVPYKVLDHEYGFSETGKTETPIDSGNLIINGDNLEALKSLLPKYEGKVNCIYIDPPYNTGNESWVYNDNVNSPQIKKWLGKVVGKESEDLTRHDKWLCMMYPRLKLLHKLLAKDGAIFISIDDNEQANLKLMMDEIFGINNFITSIIWQKKKGGGNDSRFIAVEHEYLITYVKNKNNQTNWFLPYEEKYLKRYKEEDDNGLFFWDTFMRTSGKQYYPILCPDGSVLEFDKNGNKLSWLRSESRFKDDLIKGEIRIVMVNNEWTVHFKQYLSSGKKPRSIINDIANNSDAKNNLIEIFKEQKIFDYSKPHNLISHIINIISDENSIILDSFAGSGTTAHAVLNLNKQDGGNRKFILIEMEDYAETITAERVKRVINGYADKERTGGSFDYYTLGEPLFDENNNLNETVGIEKIREYVWFTETRIPYSPPSEGCPQDGVVFLGTHNDTSYYFIYEKDSLTTLDYDALAQYVLQKAERYIIYADNCLLPETFMREKNIEFKKIPRDITRF